MSSVIYVEGGAKGADSKVQKIRCQQAFHKLLDRMGFTGRKPKLKACGSRKDVYKDFCTAHAVQKKDWIAMWIDSEDPMADFEKAWAHLATVTTVAKWKKPKGATDDQVLFMSTCMETWIVADRKSLRAHYGKDLHEKTLPPLNNLEKRDRHDVQDRLELATKDCTNAFEKGEPSYLVFGQLNPSALASLPSFVRTQRILAEKLKKR